MSICGGPVRLHTPKSATAHDFNIYILHYVIFIKFTEYPSKDFKYMQTL